MTQLSLRSLPIRNVRRIQLLQIVGLTILGSCRSRSLFLTKSECCVSAAAAAVLGNTMQMNGAAHTPQRAPVDTGGDGLLLFGLLNWFQLQYLLCSFTPCIHCSSCGVGASRLHFSEPLLPQNVETDTHASNAIEIPPYPLTGLVSMRRDYGDVMRLVISTGMRLKR